MAQDGWLKTPYDLRGKRVWVAGHTGLVGSALLRRLEGEACEILTGKFDLRDQSAVNAWMRAHRPEIIIIAAARVGGIMANATQPADFLYDNLMIQTNIIRAAHEAGVEKLLFLGSSCIYPKHAVQPITEDALLTGALEPTNEAYTIAKIAGLKLCAAYRAQHGCDFISAMPCNLYGPGDRFDEQNSHVIPALMRKAHKATREGARILEIWGSGNPLREFLYVEDLADALVFLLKNYSGSMPVNIGSGEEISIRALARMIAAVTGFNGDLHFDRAKPDGVMRKRLDSMRLKNAGWQAKTGLQDGLEKTYDWYRQQKIHVRKTSRRTA